MIIKVIKVRLYPTKAQSRLMDQIFGCCRFVYNYGLNKRETDHKKAKKTGYKHSSRQLYRTQNVNNGSSIITGY